VASSLTQSLGRLMSPAVVVLMIAFLGALALTRTEMATTREGAPATFEGIVTAMPAAIISVEIASGNNRYSFRRGDGGSWRLDRPGDDGSLGAVASHLEAAQRFMHVSTPARILGPADYQGRSLTEFGLDPPAYVVSLGTADRADVVDFGALNPAETSQYVRILGRPTLYLLPRHVGEEWRVVADMAKRLSPPADAGAASQKTRSSRLLLPASMNQVWAVETVFGGQLHRFERDDAGKWFLHVGQHTHVGGLRHVADPAQAIIISTALDAFGMTQIEAIIAHRPGPGDLDRYGLSRPTIVAVLYARDSSAPLARVEIGDESDDGFSRGARLAPDGELVKIAGYEAEQLIGLLRAVGAAS
jgi:hypothetical protein